MLKNYLLLSWRHLIKNKAASIINITGLAAGLAIALLIGLFITDELTFDHYNPEHKRIAKAMITFSSKGRWSTDDMVMVPMGKTLRDNYPDLFSRTALQCDGAKHLFGYGEKTVNMPSIWAQPELPAMFGFRMLAGSTASIKDPSTALISKSLATALFGKTDPIGKTIKADNEIQINVGGVYEDLPRNTTFYDVAVVMPWSNKSNGYYNTNTDWQDHNGYLYVELQPGVTPQQATARVKNMLAPYFDKWREDALIYPLDRYHLYNDFEKGEPSGGAIRYVWLFGIIGAFVLGLACINFMNLSTARSEKRAKEVGIRKTVGSLRGQLITQFLSESTLMSALAFFLSLVLVEITLPFFNDLAAKDMHLPFSSPLFWLIGGAVVLFTGLLAGSYPAFYLSSFNPVKGFRRPSSLPRQILVVTQFTVSLTLIIGTIIVYRQIMFARDRPVGYDRAGLINIPMNTPELYKDYETIRTGLIQNGLAANVAASSMTMTAFTSGNGLDWRGKTPDQETIMFRNVNVTPDYGATIGWTILQGRDFSREFATDSNAMILNAAAAKAIGIKNPVGETMKFFGKNYTVIGVSANMINNSPYDTVRPAIFLGGMYTSNMIVRIRPGMATKTALAAMESLFKKYNPASPFLYHFVDDDYAAKFAQEERIGNLAAVFSILAIFISCLGLFGLAAFVAEQRTKEIGIRKVLGAGVLTVWSLLSKDFFKLTALSMLIAIPIAWLGMHKWLQTYPFHPALSWWIFAAAGAGLLLITMITVSFQSLKAAFMNPLKSLRSE
jgi:ABC-type antimicrobial peptide transport system permease subunit